MQITNRAKWYRFGIPLATMVILGAGGYFWAYGIFAGYEPRVGDVVFQSLPRYELVKAIEGTTHSPYSHCGIVVNEDGQWMVLEAIGHVRTTPLRDWIFRGRNLSFAVYRLKPQFTDGIPKFVEAAYQYKGVPYDYRYQMGDDAVYCSSLVYRAFMNANGGEMGSLVKLGELDWKPFAQTIEKYEEGPVPTDRLMITPRDLAQAPQLEKVLSNRL